MLVLLLVLNIVITIKGTPIKYKQCLVGGIPSDEYFDLVAKGTPKEEIRAMMAKALDEIENKKAASEAAKAEETKETVEA